MSKLSSSTGFHLVLPAGFSCLEDAELWAGCIDKAELAIDELCAQKIIFILERMLRHPLVSKVEAGPALAGPGLKISVWINWRGGVSCLDSLAPTATEASSARTPHGDAIAGLAVSACQIEEMARSRQGARAMFAVAQANFVGQAILTRGIKWPEIATKLGAPKAACLIEAAHLAKLSKDRPAKRSAADDWESEA